MSNAIVASSSTLSGGVLTVVFKVAAGAPTITNFDMSFFVDLSKVSKIESTGPTGWFFEGNSLGNEYIVSGANNAGMTAGATAMTLQFTLTNASTTSIFVNYSGSYNTPEVKLTPMSQEFGNNLINSPATGTVTIAATATEDQALTANISGISDADGMGTVSYQWMRDGSAISGATAAQYTPNDADVGKAMSVRVSFTDGNGNTETKTSAATSNVVNVNDAPSGSVTISGSAVKGATLTAVSTLADDDGMGTLSYVWKADATVVGTNAATYSPVAADIGKTITVTVSYTDARGTNESKVSAATAVVQDNREPTGNVTISGTAIEGATLTASNDLQDADGMPGPVSYQWKAAGVDIAGATSASLVLTQAQVGKTITVTAKYTDGLGAAQSKDSQPSAAVVNVNQTPTGTATFTGTAQEGQTLTATNNLADVDGMGTVTYQWTASGTDIAGATGSTLVLGQAQVGKTIGLKASYTDQQGTSETVTSATVSAAVANVNNPATGSVTFTGNPVEDQTLTASNTLADVDGMGTVSYQWLADGTVIAGATGSTLVLQQAQVGKAVSVRASFTDAHGTAESATSTPSTPVANVNDAPTGSITVSGATSRGQTVSVASTLADEDGLGTFSYQWLADGTPITGATASTLALTDDHLGKNISVKVNYTDLFGTMETATSAARGPVVVNNPPSGTVTVTGNAVQNQTLTVTSSLQDLDGMGTVSYRWLADDVVISGANSSTLLLTQSQVGKVIKAQAFYTDGLNFAETKDSAGTAAVVNVNDAPTGTVSISGSAVQKQTLTASNTLADIDGMGTVSYQWLADGAAISGATSQTLVLGQTEVNKLISLRATYVDGQGTTEQRSSVSTARVQNLNDVATGMPTIAGMPTQGATLSVSTSHIQDIDGLGNFNYQWLADGVSIAGATGATLTLTQAQVGKAVSVRTFFTDGFGTVETLNSATTTLVANVNDPVTGTVLIEGSAIVGIPLTANTSRLADIDGLGTLGYQWMVGGVNIAGATSKTFAPTASHAGKLVSVKVSYTDGFSTSESVTSSTVSVASEDDVTPLAAPGVTPVAGDGNGDGVKDSAQAQVVSAPFSKIGSSGASENSFITLVVDSSTSGTVNNGSTAVITSIAQQAAPTTKPGKMDMPLGLIDFTAAVTTGQTETFTLFADRALGVNGYWKQDASLRWVNLASEAYGGSVTGVGNKVRLDFKITDGGEFDTDRAANGVIVDPGAMAAMPLSLVGYAPDITLTASTHFFF